MTHIRVYDLPEDTKLPLVLWEQTEEEGDEKIRAVIIDREYLKFEILRTDGMGTTYWAPFDNIPGSFLSHAVLAVLQNQSQKA